MSKSRELLPADTTNHENCAAETSPVPGRPGWDALLLAVLLLARLRINSMAEASLKDHRQRCLTDRVVTEKP